jgi:hypothetical protein
MQLILSKMYPMFQTFCSTVYCLQVTFAPGQIPVAETSEIKPSVVIETLNHTKYACTKNNAYYQCIKYK